MGGMLETYDDSHVFASSATPAGSVALEEDSPATFRRRIEVARMARKGALAIADQLVFWRNQFHHHHLHRAGCRQHGTGPLCAWTEPGPLLARTCKTNWS